ncbi:MAG: hypothetical protein JRE13_17605, partial [Deltaproteobacteria bacterium]|nr:hypothetical protein [Deltaproteobacteria bacterium]
MKGERLEALLWERIDGVIDDTDRAELEAFLAEHQGARALEEELIALADGLANVVELDPPGELRPRINRALEAARPPAGTTESAPMESSRRDPAKKRIRLPFQTQPGGPDQNKPTFRALSGIWSSETNEITTEQPGFVPGKGVSMASNNKGIIGAFLAVAVVGIVAIGYFSMHQAPALDKDAVGAVGAADRYRAEQITAEDVQIEQVELQAFLQTDEFDRLVNDPETRKLLSSEAVHQVMANEAFRSSFDNAAFQQALGNDAFRAAMGHDAFRAAIGHDAFRAAMGHDAFRAVMGHDAFRAALGDETARTAMSNDAFRAALDNDAFRAALDNDAFRAALDNDAFRAA